MSHTDSDEVKQLRARLAAADPKASELLSDTDLLAIIVESRERLGDKGAEKELIDLSMFRARDVASEMRLGSGP